MWWRSDRASANWAIPPWLVAGGGFEPPLATPPIKLESQPQLVLTQC